MSFGLCGSGVAVRGGVTCLAALRSYTSFGLVDR